MDGSGNMKNNATVRPLDRHPGLYRAQLSCKIARDAIDGGATPRFDVSRTHWALYNLSHALEEIAAAMMPGCHSGDTEDLLAAMSGALRDLMEWRQFAVWLRSAYREHGRDPSYIPLCPTDSAMDKTERVCRALAKQITAIQTGSTKAKAKAKARTK